MLFRTRKVRKKYSKLKKEYRRHFFKKVQRIKLRNWHVYHKLKKLKLNYIDNDILSASDVNYNLLYGKVHYIQKTFKENLHLSSDYCLIFKDFIKNKLIFKNYYNYYKSNVHKIFNHFDICGLSATFFTFFIVKSKVYDIVRIFRFFKNYFIIDFTYDWCYIIYSLNGGLNEFYLFYLLYSRYIFGNPSFEDIVFNDFSHLEFWLILKQYSLLNQFYFSMLKKKNLNILSALSDNVLKINMFDERTIPEISEEEIEDKKIFDSFELEESESMLLDDYVLYNKNDYLSIFKEDLSDCNFDNLCPFLESSYGNDYLKFSLFILQNVNDLFFNNLESLEHK